MTKTTEFSFRKGWLQVRHNDADELKSKIMGALGIKTNKGFKDRLNGYVEPKVSEAKNIEDIFAHYGITEIWGTEV